MNKQDSPPAPLGWCGDGTGDMLPLKGGPDRLRSFRGSLKSWQMGSVLALALVFIGGPALAQPQCRIDLANQSNATQGFLLSLDATPDSTGLCSLNTVNIHLATGDATGFHHVSVPEAWQTGVIYTAKAVITAGGPQQLTVNGQSGVVAQGAFITAPGTLFGWNLSDRGAVTEAYIVTEISLQISNGTSTVSVAPNGTNPVPLPLVLMAGGGALWPVTLNIDPTQPTIVTATFRFDAAVSNPHQFDPYVDTYGQTTFTMWAAKAASESDLAAAITEEQAWLAQNQPTGGTDIYGGSKLAGWTAPATGYYQKFFRNQRWWLISPLGNPLFYIGISGIDENYTPITGRESMFGNAPAPSGQFAPAYAQNVWGDTQNTTYLSFATANLIRKYGSGWQSQKNNSTVQRLGSWGFAGAGKWTHIGPAFEVPANPVLGHNDVANVVAGGHPDIFDPVILSQLKTSLTAQIGAEATNPNIIGWSVGNEVAEIVTGSEVQAILALGASTPAKRALVDQALAAIYGGSVNALATAWKITASTASGVYASKPTVPAADLETLRQFYEQNYYETLYKTVKAIDSNHLYLGNWILRSNPADWPIAAANCDVLGIDVYAPAFSEPDLVALVAAAGKPVLIGEFSYPSDYDGMRGFKANQYGGELTPSDSASGDLYTQWMHEVIANPWVVGVEWFEYRDEPVTGEGNRNGQSSISSSLVVGENVAFGMVDVTDRPKYGLVNKVRAANIAALEELGLMGTRRLSPREPRR